MMEIQEKSALVQVSAGFELANMGFKLLGVNCKI